MFKGKKKNKFFCSRNSQRKERTRQIAWWSNESACECVVYLCRFSSQRETWPLFSHARSRRFSSSWRVSLRSKNHHIESVHYRPNDDPFRVTVRRECFKLSWIRSNCLYPVLRRIADELPMTVDQRDTKRCQISFVSSSNFCQVTHFCTHFFPIITSYTLFHKIVALRVTFPTKHWLF